MPCAFPSKLAEEEMPTTEQFHAVSVQLLHDKATQLRIDSVRATTEAGSGHPTSCASAAEILSVLFFAVMRYDPQNPRHPNADVFVLSKGHAAPILYAAWAEAGFMPRERLLTLRKFGSDLEGHPTPRLPFVDVATGSLGQGLPAAVGIAYDSARLRRSDQRVYVLMGDGESAEGSVWEAARWAGFRGLGSLCATIDINRLGQSEPTVLQHDLATYQRRWEAFGWQALPVDGHDIPALLNAYEQAARITDRPTVVLARTRKGRDLGQEIEDHEHWHGKPLPREMADRVVADLEKRIAGAGGRWQPLIPFGTAAEAKVSEPKPQARASKRPPYEIGGKAIATRKGFGDGLAALAALDPRVVVLDGDVKNSTYTEEFEKAAPERFLQCYIAEQNMVGMAMGLAARGHVAFASTFACFLTRAYDFIRMAAISNLPLKLVGTHAGVSIGEDGPSQMGLEDLAMMCAQPDTTVLYPADATSAWRATWLVAAQPGLCYVRAGRPASPVVYGPDEPFAVGRCKILRRSERDRALIVAAGVTVAEALRAHEMLRDQGVAVRVIDLFSVKPIDQEELIKSAREAGGIVITVEDHYEHGGIGDAVFAALSAEPFRGYKLAVREIPRSGTAPELLKAFGIDAGRIASAVRTAIG
jgi:transketolase